MLQPCTSVNTKPEPHVGTLGEIVSPESLNVNVSAQGGGHVSAPTVSHSTVQGNIHNISHHHHHHHHSTEKLADAATQRTVSPEMVLEYKEWICSEYKVVQEYNSLPEEDVLLTDRYIDLLIVQKHRQQKEREEDICSGLKGDVTDQSKEVTYKQINLDQLFSPMEDVDTPKAVILQGHSGHGKSFTVQKIMYDWALGELYAERFDLVFHLQCRKLNNLCERTERSVEDLLNSSCGGFSEMLQHCSSQKLLLIIDAFDELKSPLEEPASLNPKDPFTPAPTEATLRALLKGLILPKCFLLVTTRSTAADKLSKLLKHPQRYTEILGFSEEGVREYFHRFCQDEQVSEKLYNSVRVNETLFTSCFIPVICWIVCTVIKEQVEGRDEVTSDLETTTSIFVHFVTTLLEHHCQGLSQPVPTLLRGLGQLAERGMLEQRVLFEKDSVKSKVSDPSSVPFLCKFLMKKKVSQEEMFSFMHLSFQEFFTALYYTLDQNDEKANILLRSLHGAEGGAHLRPVIQFLFGLSNMEVQKYLEKMRARLPLSSWVGFFRSLLPISISIRDQLEGWILAVLAKKRGVWGADMKLFILNCLYELHEEEFVRRAMEVWGEVNFHLTPLTRANCWVLLYCLQCCPAIRSLRLTKCNITSDKLRMLLPALSRCEELGLAVEELLDVDVSDLVSALGEGKMLRCLDVSSMSNESVQQIFTALSRQKSVGKVQLSVKCINISTAGMFFQLLQDTNLMWLSLRAEDTEDKGCLCTSLSVGQYISTVSVTAGQRGQALSRVSLILTHSSQVFNTKRWTDALQAYHTLEDITEDTPEYDEHVNGLLCCLASLPDLKEVYLWVGCLTESWAIRILSLIHISLSSSLECCRVQLSSHRDCERESLCTTFSVKRDAHTCCVTATQVGPALSRVTVTHRHCPEINSVLWVDLLKTGYTLLDIADDVAALFSCLASMPGVRSVELFAGCLTDSWATGILSLIHNCPTLQEVQFECYGVLLKESVRLLHESPKRPDCTLTLRGCYGHWGDHSTHSRIVMRGNNLQSDDKS